MNKNQLIDTLAAHFEGNRKAAAHALDSVLDTITREVAKGEKVAITGFGSFERKVREARWVRNPQTGARVEAKQKTVPTFRPGAQLRDVVSGARKLPALTLATVERTPAAAAEAALAAAHVVTGGAVGKRSRKKVRAADTAEKAPEKGAEQGAAKATRKAPAKKTATKKAPAAKKTTAQKSTAKKAPAKASTTKKSTAKKSTAKKSTAKKSTATKSTAKKSASSSD